MKLWRMASSSERIGIVSNRFYYSNIRYTEDTSFLNLGKQHCVTHIQVISRNKYSIFKI